MDDDQFTKLFKYIEKRFDSVEQQLEQKADKEDVNRIITTLDSYATKIDDYAMEMAAMQHKIDRLERMVDFLAKKVGVSKSQLDSL